MREVWPNQQYDVSVIDITSLSNRLGMFLSMKSPTFLFISIVALQNIYLLINQYSVLKYTRMDHQSDNATPKIGGLTSHERNNVEATSGGRHGRK